ncbi:MAG: SP_1767 family glycosyltransferase [bacterium]
MEKTVKYIRKNIPLPLRRKLGPIVAYFSYLYSIYFQKKTRLGFKVLTPIKTLDVICQKNLSVIRFGDGEMSLIEKEDLAFQKQNDQLSSRLKAVLQSKLPNLLICIPNIWGRLENFNKNYFWFSLHHLFKYKKSWSRLLSKDQIYGDAFISRPYLSYKDASQAGVIFQKLFSIWQGKEVILIEGSKSRLGVGNDMFDKAKSVSRILCPSENAYSKYEEIKKEALKAPTDRLILLSLGPAAKVLAYDLFMLGYRVIDIGHIDMEYEMFLRKENKIVPVKNKYFNEINERNPESCSDPKYLNQIIAHIK